MTVEQALERIPASARPETGVWLKLFRAYLKVPGWEKGASLELTSGQALLLWLYALLRSRRPIKPELTETLFEVWGEKLLGAANAIVEGTAAPQLAFIDGEFAILSGEGQYLKLETGLPVDKLDEPKVEMVLFDFTGLWLRNGGARANGH